MPGGGATSIMTKPFDGNALTSDPARYARNARLVAEHMSLAIGDPTLGWIRAAFGQMAEFAAARYPLEIATPVLILAAGEDQVVSTPAIEAFAARLKTGPAILLPGARHEILQETEATRAAFWAAFDAFAPGVAARRSGRTFEATRLPAHD
jgi:lysophospholipase